MSPPAYTGERSLADRFRSLVCDGTPLSEAPALLFDLYVAGHFHTASPLPEEVDCFRLGGDGNLVVELSDGRKFDTEKILTREPHFLDAAPIPLSTLRALRHAKAEEKEEEEKLLVARLVAAARNGEPREPSAAPPEQQEQPKPTPAQKTTRGHGGHSLAVVLEGWLGRFSLPLVQEYLAQLIASGEIVLSQELPEGWWLVSAREHLPSWGVVNSRIVIVTSSEWYDPAEYRCHLPNDLRLVGPLQLSRLQKPAVAEEPPKTDADSQPAPPQPAATEDPPKEKQPEAAPDNNADSKAEQSQPAPDLVPEAEPPQPDADSPSREQPEATPEQPETASDNNADSQTEPQASPDPAPETELASRRSGRPPEHPWEGAACYVDEWIKKTGHPLERDPDGVPIIQRGIDLMKKGFEQLQHPKPPSDRYIREWINSHPERISAWW